MVNRRVKAFTIIEVTVAMLLSAIVIGITYTIFSIVSHAYHDYQLRHEKMAALIKLDELLQKDFDRAEIIMKDTDGIAIKKKAQIIRYRFNEDYVLRTGASVDTFKVKTDSVVSSFEGQAVINSDTSDEQSRVDQLDLLIALDKEKIPYYYHKIYSSVNLINRKSNAVN